ncbi:MAG TPA: Fur family transcriptional regulator [Streptosporangiaceae bacterium]|nr:Fur family transcriptional regulator [Streptosporangiaceae bacterium]
MTQQHVTRVRSTRQADAITAAMSGMRAFGGAREIHRALLDRGQQVGLATVYRHLHLLAERGDVDTIHTPGGESRYRLRASSSTFHLTCRACGLTVAVDASEVGDWAKRVAAEAGYTLTSWAVELTGLCPAHSGA